MGVIFLGAEEMSEAPRPESLRVTLEDAGRAVRTAGGRAVRYLPRPPLRTVRIVWKELDAEEAARILAVISRDSFRMRYPDPLEGGSREAEFFCAARDAVIAWAHGDEMRVGSLSCSLSEV